MMIPPMLFRTIGDNLRAMVQAMGYMRSLGVANFANILAFFGYSFLLLNYFEGNSLLAYALAMTIYELCSLI